MPWQLALMAEAEPDPLGARRLPSSLVDHARARERRARPRVARALAVFAPFPRLYGHRVTFGAERPAGAELAGALRALVGAAPAWWKLERGRAGDWHAHLTTPLPRLDGPGAAHSGDVPDLGGWLAYLSKPADARLCLARPAELARLPRAARARQMLDGLREHQAARHRARAEGRRRLPAASGWLNARRRAPVAPLQLARLALAVAAARLRLLTLWAAARRAAPLPYPPAARRGAAVRLLRAPAALALTARGPPKSAGARPELAPG